MIFDENNHILLTLWSLNEHIEILPMRFALIYHNVSSKDLYEIPSNNNEHLYLACVNGDFRMLDLLKIKPRAKVQVLSNDDTSQHSTVLQNQELNRLVCLTNDIIAISTTNQINLFGQKDISKILQTINFTNQLFSWNMINQDDNTKILMTIDSSQKFITIYHQEKDIQSSLKSLQIEFRSNVKYIRLIQTTTIMDNEEKKKTYVLILLDDHTVQLLDTTQLSQSSLKPKGLLTRMKSFNVVYF